MPIKLNRIGSAVQYPNGVPTQPPPPGPISFNQEGGVPTPPPSKGAINGGYISTKVFRYKCLVQIYHWQTTSFSRHKGADELSGSLNGFLDKFMETYMGKYGRPTYSRDENIIKLYNQTDLLAVSMLDEMTDFFTSSLPLYLDDKKDTDLLNIRDEILAGINQVKYLYTLA